MSLGKFRRSGADGISSHRDPALGVWSSHARTGYVLLAAPSVLGRRVGMPITPAIGGLFRRGPAVGISQINAIATNIMRGSG